MGVRASSVCDVSMASRPPLGIASRAFTARLMIASSSWLASALAARTLPALGVCGSANNVFADPAARRRLEAITHPRIRALAAERIAALAGSDAPYCVLVVPLLIESGAYDALCDRVLVVDVPPDVQLARVLARDGADETLARSILAAQLPRATRLAAADDVLDNAGPLAKLDAAVAALDRRYRALAAGRKA